MEIADDYPSIPIIVTHKYLPSVFKVSHLRPQTIIFATLGIYDTSACRSVHKPQLFQQFGRNCDWLYCIIINKATNFAHYTIIGRNSSHQNVESLRFTIFYGIKPPYSRPYAIHKHMTSNAECFNVNHLPRPPN